MPPVQETRAVRVHDELSGGTGKITFREFHNGTSELDIRMDEVDWKRVFDRGDTNRDGTINSDEWMIFSQFYPTLVDSLYYRIEDKWKTLSREEDQHFVSLEVQNLRKQFADTLATAAAAELDLVTLRKNLTTMEHDCEMATVNCQHSKQLLEESRGKTLAAQNSLDQRHQDLAQRITNKKDMTLKTTQFGPTLRKLAKEVKVKEDDHFRLQADLQRAERHAAQLRLRVAKSGTEIDQKVIEYEDMTRRKTEHQQHVRQLQEDICNSEDEIKIAEAEIQANQEIEIQVTQLHSNATADVADKITDMKFVASRIVDIERAMLCMKDEALHANIIAESRKVDLDRLQNDHRVLLEVREATTSAERRLISNEIALQGERDSLEKVQKIYDRVSNQVLTRIQSPHRHDNMTIDNLQKSRQVKISDTAQRSSSDSVIGFNNRSPSISPSRQQLSPGINNSMITHRVAKVQPHEK